MSPLLLRVLTVTALTIYHILNSFFSVLLLAICDFDGKFIYIQTGWPGKCGDAQAFRESHIGRHLQEKYGDGHNLPPGDSHCLIKGGTIGGRSFWLGALYDPTVQRCIWPCSWWPDAAQFNVFNYRHSAGRLVIEQAFGLLKNRWKVLQGRFSRSTEKMQGMINVLTTLHNFMLVHDRQHYVPHHEVAIYTV